MVTEGSGASTAGATQPAPQDVDVLVMGGGPGGSTAAALLAERGLRVALLEKAHHPRFHIGESLLPANLPLLAKLGVAEEVNAIGMEKWGAEFVSPWHEQHTQMYEFAEAWDKSMPMSYQVRRSEFDHILIRNAARKGAAVYEGCTARDVQFLPDAAGAVVSATHDDGTQSTWAARMVIDATGRDTLLASRLKAKHRDPKHNSAALYAHYTGVQRLDGKAQAMSPSSGSSMAGSGSFHWPTAPPASAPWSGRITSRRATNRSTSFSPTPSPCRPIWQRESAPQAA
jgi:Dehydrogenases (flavoproteins)